MASDIAFEAPKVRSLGTPDALPWSHRRYPGGQPSQNRSSYEIDRDRIIHAETFRDLQHKTQVQGLSQGWTAQFRTRLNHVIEVAQLAGGIAAEVDATRSLAEAIALAHDLGHPPFGHAGERALREALQAHGEPTWNANVHSLAVVDDVECAFIKFRGLNLTWSTREGIARHSTPFDEPVSVGEFSETPQGGLECQVVDAADVLAYLSHDLDDALAGRFIDFPQLYELSYWPASLISDAEREWEAEATWPASERHRLLRRYVVARLISGSIRDFARTTRHELARQGAESPADVRQCSRVVKQSPEMDELTRALLGLLTKKYYRSDVVAEMDSAAEATIKALFDWYVERPNEIPERFQTDGTAIAVANYIASLNDFSAAAKAKSLGLTQRAPF